MESAISYVGCGRAAHLVFPNDLPQVLVLHDMLGITQEFSPRFLRRYADLENAIEAAITGYISDVRAKSFPSDDESY